MMKKIVCLFRTIGVLLLLTCWFADLYIVPTTSAQQPVPSEPLDSPLVDANICGAGDMQDTHFTLAATGDTLLHMNIQAVAEAQGYDYLFDHVRPYLQAADIAYTNVEGAMMGSSHRGGYPAFNYNPALATALQHAGIDVVSTANNHILDRGPAGVAETLQALDQHHIAHHGAVVAETEPQNNPPYTQLILNRGDVSLRVAFISFTWGTNGIPDYYNQVNLIWTSSDYGQQGEVRQETLDAIAQAKSENDLVVVAPHWGLEYISFPNEKQRQTAVQLAAAGADIILGGHPHTLQPVDMIETNGRKTLIIYSLGNFIASQGIFQAQSFTSTTVIFYVGIVREADGTVRITGYRYLPILIVDNDTRPMPIANEGNEYIIDHIRRMMRDPFGIRQIFPSDQAIVQQSHYDQKRAELQALFRRNMPIQHDKTEDEIANPLPAIAVCPHYTFPNSPDTIIGGDFAQYLITPANGTQPRPFAEIVAINGYPLGPVVEELSADCQQTTHVLYTERQRLELHPQNDWTHRVVGSQLGTQVYQQRYGGDTVERYHDIDTVVTNPDFNAYFHTYGGVQQFGYPISHEMQEIDEERGEQRRVQYFERARLEVVPDQQDNPDLLQRVQLGLLSLEYAGIEAQCGIAPISTETEQTSALSQHEPSPSSSQKTMRWWGWMMLLAGGLIIGDLTLSRRKPYKRHGTHAQK